MDFRDELAKQMKSKGFDDDTIARMRREFIPQSELTRIRQEDAREFAAIKAQLQQLAQNQNAGGGAPGRQNDDAIEATLSELGLKDEQIPIFRKMLQSAVSSAEQRIERKFAPFVQGVTGDYQNRQMQEHKQSLINRFGKDAEPYWDEVQARMQHYQQNGYAVDPVSVFMQVQPEVSQDLLVKSAQRAVEERKNQTRAQSTEGFTHQRTAVPLAGAHEGQEANGERPRFKTTEELIQEVEAELAAQGKEVPA